MAGVVGMVAGSATPLAPNGPLGIGHLHDLALDVGHVHGGGHEVERQRRRARHAVLQNMLLVKAVAQAHGGAALDLPLHRRRVDGLARVRGGNQLGEADAPGLRIHLYLGQLGGPAIGGVGVPLGRLRVHVIRGVVVPTPGGGPAAVEVKLLRHLAHGHQRPVGFDLAHLAPGRTSKVLLRALQHARGHVEDLPPQLLGRPLHRHPLDEGGAAARGGPGVRRAAGIGRHHADLVGLDAQLFRGHLGHHGHDALAHVTGAGVDRGGAVLGHLDLGRADVGPAETVADAVVHGADAQTFSYCHGR